MRPVAKLALADGTIFTGTAFGADGELSGEVVFNTSMTGYQEILTDPSYRGQVVTLTYPEIGNYGVCVSDDESYQPHASGLIVRELSPIASNFRSEMSLEQYLEKHNLPGLCHVDTRALTKKLRVHGAMKGVLSTEGIDAEEAIALARQWTGLVGQDYVKEVTCREAFVWDEEGIHHPVWADRYQLEQGEIDRSLPPMEYNIVAYDYGMKTNILRCLREQGFRVTVVPAQTPGKDVLAMNPDGIFLSNGPGDPAALDYAHEAVGYLVGTKPLFGICLGHQVLSHALGGTTFKLKFGHRGGNQPVKDLRSGEVKITSQNHGFAVDGDSFPEDLVEVTHINLNDRTCEGLCHKHLPAFSVQYHPEAAPGPHDAAYFFKQFRQSVADAH